MESPYGDTLPPGMRYARLAQLRGHPIAEALVSALRSDGETREQLLLQVTDWSHHDEEELPRVLQDLVNAFPNERNPFFRSGAAFTEPETSSLVEACAWVIEHGMSAYVYSGAPKLTAYLWEGEFLEFWAPEPTILVRAVHTVASAGAVLVVKNDG